MGRWDSYIKTQKPCSNEKCSALVWKGKYCSKCRQRLRRNGDVNAIKPKHRKYHFNEKFFDNWTNEMAWCLGWLASDGCVLDTTSPRIEWELKDGDILEKIRILFEHPKPPKPRRGYFSIRLHSIHLVNRCKQLGIHPRKSLTIELPKIPDQYFYHFLRGVIEGDGSVINCDGRLFVFINSGSRKLLEQIKTKVSIGSGEIIEPNKDKINPCYRLVWTGKKAKQLCELVYKDSDNIRLVRKHNKYQEILNG